MNDSVTFAGSSMNQVKQANMSAVLRSLLHSGATSRVQLAAQTSLSNTTITNLTAELLEQGIIAEESGGTRSDGQRRVGRPRQMLRLVPNSRYVVGVHVGIGVFRVALANIQAELLCNHIYHFDRAAPATAVVNQIGASIVDIITEAGVAATRVLGAGIGLSGLVNHREGINHYAPRLGWHDVPVQSLLQAKAQMPVCIDNNVRAMALGEALFGAGRLVQVLAFIYGRVGVGAGFVVNGRIFRGSGAGAGEIGHSILMPIPMQPDCQPQPVTVETLETLVSEPAILQEATELARSNTSLAAYLEDESIAATPIARVFAAARDGDEPTREMLAQRAYFLGVALANLVNMLNPELIILGGMFAEGEDLLLPAATSTMKQLSFAGLGEKVRLQPTSFGWRAGVIGASALALSNFVYMQPVR